MQRYEQTGEVKARPDGGGQCPKLTPEQVAQVAGLVAADNDATLAELSHQLPEKIGIPRESSHNRANCAETTID